MTVKIKHLLLLVVLVVLLLPYLTRVPTPYIDEMWHIDTGWNFVNSGKLALTAFGGIAGINQVSFQLPVFNILMGWWLALFGLGIFQARLMVVVMAGFILALTYLIGRALFDEKVALVGSIAVYFWCYIVFRYIRYDIGVAVFFMAGFYSYLVAEMRNKVPLFYLVPGVLCGLASVSHSYGIIGAVAIIVLFLIRHKARMFTRRELWFFILGVAVPLLLYVAYIWPYRKLILEQLKIFAPGRYSVFSHVFYLRNIITEVQRWSHPFSAIFLGSVALLLFWHRKKLKQHLPLLVTILVFLIFFTLFIQVKTFVYALAICPLIALCASAFWLDFWGWCSSKLKLSPRISQVPIVVLLTLLVLARPTRAVWKVWHVYGVRESNYSAYLEQISDYVPAKAKVLAQQGLWLGFPEQTFYAEYVVTVMKNAYAMTFSEAVRALEAEYVVIDETFLHYQNDPDIDAFLEAECTMVATVKNDLYSNFPGYGTEHDGVTRIYSVKQR